MQSFIQYYTERTIEDLTKGTEDFRDVPKKVYPQSAKIDMDNIVPALGVKTITFYAEVPSFTHSGKYQQTIMFKDIKFSDKQESPEWKYIENANVKTWFDPPSLTTNDCFVRCSCLDFRFRWMYSNKDKNALFGKLIPYKKKTDRPPLNPDKIEGYCKHIYNMLAGLTHNGYVKE